MDFNEIIRKAAEGESLDAEEREFLKSYRPDEELRSELESVRSERDRTAGELAEMRRRQKIDSLAMEYQFTDPDYLAFRFDKMGIEPDSENAHAAMEGLKKQCPRLFKLDIRPGVPANSGTHAAPLAYSAADELTRQLENAPDAH